MREPHNQQEEKAMDKAITLLQELADDRTRWIDTHAHYEHSKFAKRRT